MEKMNDLRDLLKHEIEDLQSVEDQILEALPKMIEKANNPDLKKALSEHLQVTQQHKTRLEKIMKEVQPKDEESNGKKKGIMGIFGGGKHVCKGMKGIIEEGEKIMNSDISPEALDAAIIASAQKVEHYEICGYGTARTFARELGMEQIARQLEQTLNEEYEADDLLTSLALMGVNEEAETANGSASASSRGRSAGRVKEKANREMEMEPVASNRSRSTARSETAGGSKDTASSRSNSGTPRGENGRSGSSKRAAGNTTSKSSSAGNSRSSANGRSSSGGRGGASKASSRGRR
jgi:ferritin-like metal-binding protein YciE